MDKTRIIAVANHKGGVGKTTTVATLGSIFAKVGVRVLMVDLDAQCNLTDTFLSEVEGPTVYEVFKDRRDYRPTRIKDGLDILPASLDMSALDLIIGGQFEKERILSDVLEKMNISERYDLVLLDCPPSLGLVTVNALVAADEVYVPIAPEVYPLKGLVKLEEICSMVSARLNPGIGITGVIVTMFNPTKNLFVTVDEKLRGIYGDKVSLRKESYRTNGTLAVIMDEVESGDEFAVITVNLCSPMQDGSRLAFVDTNNIEGIDKWLVGQGLATHAGVLASSGFCTYPLMSFNTENF